MTRQLVLDTETTGLSCEDGDRLVEIGIVELIDRKVTGRVFHRYVDPGFEVPEEAVKVHGLTREQLIHSGGGKTFKDIADELIAFIDSDELIIHNAGFDMGFLDHELVAHRRPRLSTLCKVFDTLRFAGVQFPGSRNNLDALCKRFGIDTSERTEHGALLDASLLAEVYLSLTRRQTNLDLDGQSAAQESVSHAALLAQIERLEAQDLPIIQVTEHEQAAHDAYLRRLTEKAGQSPRWQPAKAPTANPNPAGSSDRRPRSTSPAPF